MCLILSQFFSFFLLYSSLEVISNILSSSSLIHSSASDILLLIPSTEEKKKGYKKFFEEIIVENFPNMEKEIVDQVQEAQSPIKNKPKEKHTKTHTNQTNKDQTQIKNIKSHKG